MDEYYQNYKSNNDFFSLGDFIFYCGMTMGEFYSGEFKNQKAEMKAEGNDSYVSFDPSVLNEMDLDVKTKDGQRFAEYTSPIFTFAFDSQGIGVQTVDPIPFTSDCCRIERLSNSGEWLACYVDDQPFFTVGKKGLTLRNTNVNKVRVAYVPAIPDGTDEMADVNVPDGIIDYVLANTIQLMKAIADGTIVKKSIDQNQNKTLQTEINPKSLAR